MLYEVITRKEAEFDKLVNRAMNDVVKQLERSETAEQASMIDAMISKQNKSNIPEHLLV